MQIPKQAPIQAISPLRRWMRRQQRWVAALCCGLSVVAQAATAEAAKSVARPPAATTQPDPSPVDIDALLVALKDSYRQAGHFTVRFTQSYRDALQSPIITEEGQLTVHRDGRFTWQYDGAERKTFMFDGQAAYFFEPKLAQVTLLSDFRDAPLGQALALLAGRVPSLKEYDITPCSGGAQCAHDKVHEVALRCAPKVPIPQMKQLALVFAKNPWRIVRAVAEDALNNQTTYVFSQFTPRQHVDEALFVFKPDAKLNIIRAGART